MFSCLLGFRHLPRGPSQQLSGQEAEENHPTWPIGTGAALSKKTKKRSQLWESNKMKLTGIEKGKLEKALADHANQDKKKGDY